jgi:bacillolysin
MIAGLGMAQVGLSAGSSRDTTTSRRTAAPVTAKSTLDQLQARNSEQLQTLTSRQTGNFSFVRAQRGTVLVADDTAATPEARALAFLATHGALVGMNATERAALGEGRTPDAASELRIIGSDVDKIGFTHVRLDQRYNGLPVFGAELIVHMNNSGITAVNGNYIANIALKTVPSLSEGAAAEQALALLRKAARNQDLLVKKVELAVYPLGLLEGFPVQSRLAWAVELDGSELHEQVWIDAHSGALLNRIPLRHSALNRRVYSPQYNPSQPDLFVVHKEEDPVVPPPNPATPTANLFHFAGHTYNFFASAFGRDSYDGNGIMMRSVYLVNEICPNAYWNGQSTNYCPEIDSDDVVAHEWGHAYTQFTHDLIYSYQSGALNESYSDIWGEAVDLHNGVDFEGGANNSQPRPQGQRWQVGEDVPVVNEPALGILRNMWDPTEYANPDKVSSEFYHCDSSDAGGVHVNSGVPNHAFAMLVDGKTFNGTTVQGIGFVKAVQIYWRAGSVYQTRSSNFVDHEQALLASTDDLMGAPLVQFSTSSPTGTPSLEVITPADKLQVQAAMQAVEMSAPVPCTFGPLLNPEAPPLCNGASDLFLEDWETGDDGWTRTSTGVFADWEDSSRHVRDFKHRSSLPGGRQGSAVFAANPPIGEEGGGTCTPGNGDYSGQFTIDSPNIPIPAGAEKVQMAFDHYVATEVGYDGGQVEISRNGGAYQLVPQNRFTFNAPNSAFSGPPPVGNNTNPNAGEPAWTGTDTGSQAGSWGRTIVDLAGMGVVPGDTIRVRFTFSQDGCNGVLGWFVDNVRVFNCPLLEAPVLSIGSGYQDPDPDGSYQLTWTRPQGATGPEVVQESTSSCAPLLFEDAENGIARWDVSTQGAYAGFNWQTSTEKPQHNSTTFRARGAEGVASAAALLTYRDPIVVPNAGSTRLTWQDWNVNEGDDSVHVEVSEDGVNWTAVYTHQRSELAPDAVEFYGLEPLFAREVDMSAYRGRTIRLRFRYQLGPENRAGSTPFGWYIDNIALQNEHWQDLLSTSATTATINQKPPGTYCYRVRTTYNIASQQVASSHSNVVTVNVASGPTPVAAVSRKNHGAQPFDINLPLTGTPGIESRGLNGQHQVIVTFAGNVGVSGGGAVTRGSGTVSNVTVNGGQVTISLSNVADAQRMVVTLFGVSDGQSTGGVSIPINVLLADTTANGAVNSSDVSFTKPHSGQAININNFRADVDANGAITSTDIGIVKSRSGSGLPSEQNEVAAR